MGLIAGIGAAALIGGTVASANAAKGRKTALNNIANTPGIDPNAITGEALSSIGNNQGTAEGIAGRANHFSQDQVNAMLEQAIPGWSGLQAKRTANAADLLAGRLPSDVQSAVERSAASRALGGGYGGSGAGRNLTLRDLGRTSLDATTLGANQANTIVSDTPHANLFNLAGLLGPSPTDLAGIRSSERTLKLNQLTGATNAPGPGDVYGKAFQQVGGTMLGSSGVLGGSKGAGATANTNSWDIPGGS